MKIIRKGYFDTKKTNVEGQCPRCGCIFTAQITDIYANNGAIVSTDADSLVHFRRSIEGCSCACPHCGLIDVVLTEIT